MAPKKKYIYIYKKNTFRPGLCFSLSVQEQLNEKYLQMQRSICFKSLWPKGLAFANGWQKIMKTYWELFKIEKFLKGKL